MKPFRFGLIGEYQSGKSLLTNCLLRRSIATVGVGNATTHTVVNYQYGEDEYAEYVDDKHNHHCIPINELNKLDTVTNIEVIDIYLSIDFLKSYTLTDMPGFGANTEDNEIARKVLLDIDFAILIAWSDKTFGETSDTFRNLKALRTHRIPYYFVLNCTKIDRWRCDDEGNMVIAQKDFNMLSLYPPSRYPLEANGINIVNLMWYWYSICNSDDELTSQKKYKNAFESYGIDPSIKNQLRGVSKFELINRLFDMEHRDFLELKRSFREEIKSLKNELCPIGTIQTFAFESIPHGWLICDGHPFRIDEYPELYNAIGYTFGGEGTENFNVPDLRGQFIRGWCGDNKIRKFGSTQNDALQNHSHVVVSCSENGNHYHRVGTKQWNRDYANTFYTSLKHKDLCDYGSDTTDYSTNNSGGHSHDITIGKPANASIKELVRTANETRPQNIALMYCIKATS